MESVSNTHKVVILGATGLVGHKLLEMLLAHESITEVVSIGRRSPTIEHIKLKNVVIEMDRLDDYGDLFHGASSVFCCLGTTIKQAKSRINFRRVDFDYPLLAAKIARTRGVTHFLLISAQGANQRSPFFYSRVKGELEAVIAKIGFPRFTIFRPGLLLGKRVKKRPLEDFAGTLMKRLNPIWPKNFEKFAAIEAQMVARAMLESVTAPKNLSMKGLEVLEF